MQLTGLGLGFLGNLKEVAKDGLAGVVAATCPLGAGGWGPALGLVLRGLGGFGSQEFLVIPPLLVPLPVPGGALLLPGRSAAAALQRALLPRFAELLFDRVPYGDLKTSESCFGQYSEFSNLSF